MKPSPLPSISRRHVLAVALTLAQLALLSLLFMAPTGLISERVLVVTARLLAVFVAAFCLAVVNLFVLDVVARWRL